MVEGEGSGGAGGGTWIWDCVSTGGWADGG